ncbi:MAG TPA: hypothetical protein PKK56_01900 [archaeon]|nr:hypothetical protein [archaeon]
MDISIINIESGKIDLKAIGENAFILRKGKKIKIPSTEDEAKVVEKFNKTKDKNILKKFKEEYPKLIDGDTIISGKQTYIGLNNGYNKGKENPVEDYKYRASKIICIYPNSELKVSGIESWDKTDKKTRKRCYGGLIKNIELKKGLFSVSYSRSEEPIITPIASIKFISSGSGFFDVYDNILYSSPTGSVEYTNRLTKKSFIAKSQTPEEIIVTKDGIYRKGMSEMDEIFQYKTLLLTQNQFKFMDTIAFPGENLNEKQMAEQYKNIPKTIEQAIGAMEMFKQMSPDDMERLMKMGEAQGTKIAPEMMEQMKQIPDLIKAMEKEGDMKELKQATAMSKGLIEGLGEKGTELLVKTTLSTSKKLKKTSEDFKTQNKKAGIDIDKILESPRTYKPLTGAKKVA